MDNIYDSQVKVIADSLNPWMQSMSGTAMNLEDFRKQIIERFEKEAKLEVDVLAYYTDEEGTIAFEVDIQRNLMRWDPDQQVHEVLHNELDLPEDRDKGIIRTDSKMIEELGASPN